VIDKETSFGDTTLREQLQRAVQTLAGNAVQVHALDAAGLRLDTSRGDDFGSGKRAAGSLALLAGETGGQLLENSNDLAGSLEQVQQASRALYLLGFYPDEITQSGRYHPLEVKVARKGLTVFARPGYFEDRPYEQTSALERQFQLAEAILKGVTDPARFEPRCSAAAFATAGGRVRAPLLAEVPLDSFSPDPKGAIRLEVFGFVIDAGGRFHDYFERQIRLPRAELEGHGITAVRLLEAFQDLGPGRYRLRLVARDPIGGAIAAATAELEVPDFGLDELYVSTPIFGGGQGRSIPLWGLSSYPKSEVLAELPEFLAADAADPRPAPELRSGDAAEVAFRAYHIRLDPTNQQPRIQMAFRCRDPDGAQHRVSEVKLAGPPQQVAPGVFDVRLQLRLPYLGPGEWEFEVELTDEIRGASFAASAPLRVGS
jgi:hypothetical protein